MVPFVKWVGGKRQIIKRIEKHWPSEYNTYYEPFVGGGAVLFHFTPEKAVINDLNSELINLYRVISQNSSYKRFREYLLLMEHGHHVVDIFDEEKQKYKKDSPFYRMIASTDRNKHNKNKVISLENSTKEFRAARFIFLNKNSFNGLYRVNSKGHYNVPSKHNPTNTFSEENIKNISSYLNKSVEIHNDDFEKIAEMSKKGDFIYFDPPYDFEVGEKGFESYQKEGFGIDGQKKLANLCKRLDEKGVKFLLSNHNTKLIKNLYKGFAITKFKANRLIGGKGSKRKPVYEVLVKNYE